MLHRTRRPWVVAGCLLALAPLATASARAAGPPPDYGFTFVTVGDPGNAPFPGENGINVNRGGVGYAYRMATTEVTVAQWLEFVEAYSPFAEHPTLTSLTGDFIVPSQSEPVGPVTYSAFPDFVNTPTNMSWRMAARYVNWLHNDKAITRDAFERGVYDTSTFTQNPDGSFNDQTTHAPGARYWIPTYDEALKAVYYDPNRHGPGEDGWWMYPAGSDTPLIAGAPEDGGQTNYGLFTTFDYEAHRDVGSYPEITTRWGLLDASGGMREWTEEWSSVLRTTRRVRGSGFSSVGDPSFEDNILFASNEHPTSVSVVGLRIASAIPAPGGVPLMLMFLPKLLRRSRQCWDERSE